jgi:hypothetical protein
MPTTFTDIVQHQIESLEQEIAIAKEKRDQAEREIVHCSQIVERNEAKIEALSDTLMAARRIDGPAVPSGVPARNDGHERPRLKATEAILAFIDEAGSASREALMSLSDNIDTTAGNPRHIMQTTLYQLVKKGKLVDTGGMYKRPKQSAQ